MLRTRIFAASVLALASTSASADVWMVKSSGILGCGTRAKAVEIGALPSSVAPGHDDRAGCVMLDVGERLIEQSKIGSGFDDYLRAQRHDGSVVFVHSSAVVRDPGFGSIDEDRRE